MLVGSVGYILSLGATAWAFCAYGRQFDALGGAIVLVMPETKGLSLEQIQKRLAIA